MANEIDLEVRNSIRALQSQVQSLVKVQGQATAEMRKFAGEAGAAFRKPAQEAGEFGEKLGHAAHALGRFGGPLREIAHRLGGAGMSGWLGRAAVAAGVAGLAFEAFNRVLEHQVESTREVAEGHQKVAEAIDAAEKKAGQLGLKGVGQAERRRRLRAAGGDDAERQVADISSTGVVSEDEATDAVTEIYKKLGRGKRAELASGHALLLAKAGMPIGEAARGLLEAGAPNDFKAALRTAENVYGRYSGRQVRPSAALGEGLDNVRGDPFLEASARNQTVLNQIPGVERQHTLEGGTERESRAALAEAKDPVSAALVEINRTYEKHLEVLKEMAKTQGQLGHIVANIGLVFGGQGSLQEKILRAERERAGANFDGPAPSDEVSVPRPRGVPYGSGER